MKRVAFWLAPSVLEENRSHMKCKKLIFFNENKCVQWMIKETLMVMYTFKTVLAYLEKGWLSMPRGSERLCCDLTCGGATSVTPDPCGRPARHHGKM